MENQIGANDRCANRATLTSASILTLQLIKYRAVAWNPPYVNIFCVFLVGLPYNQQLIDQPLKLAISEVHRDESRIGYFGLLPCHHPALCIWGMAILEANNAGAAYDGGGGRTACSRGPPIGGYLRMRGCNTGIKTWWTKEMTEILAGLKDSTFVCSGVGAGRVSESGLGQDLLLVTRSWSSTEVEVKS